MITPEKIQFAMSLGLIFTCILGLSLYFISKGNQSKK